MSKKKKNSSTLKARLEREGKALTKAFLNRTSVKNKKKMEEDFAVIDEILTSDPSLYDTLFESLNNRINSGSASGSLQVIGAENHNILIYKELQKQRV